jgi:hypothetical protein
MTSGDAADRLRAQRSRGAVSDGRGDQTWRGKGGLVFMKGVMSIKLDWVTKSGSTSHDPRCHRCQKRRQMSRKLELRCSLGS